MINLFILKGYVTRKIYKFVLSFEQAHDREAILSRHSDRDYEKLDCRRIHICAIYVVSLQA